MADPSYLLQLSGITKTFPGVLALDEVSLDVRRGTVHALMGENGAGKSTLMKCVFGIYRPDAGTMVLDGVPVELSNSKQALDLGISMIHQELHPIPYRSVMENLWLGRYPTYGVGPFRLVDHARMRADTLKLFAELQIDLDPDIWLKDLSVSKIQSLEIARAVSYDSKVIIMDEPTSSLSEAEVHHLFRVIEALTAKGVAVIYISHKMDEILRISDDVTIMRDGKRVGTYPASDLSVGTMIKLMVGRDLTHRFPPRNSEPGDVLMRIEDYSSPNPKSFQSVSFELRRGEILGVSGLVGAQRTELVEAIFGIRDISRGKIFIDGKLKRIRHPYDAKLNRMALLTEDRRATGIFPILSVADNALIARWDHYASRFGLLDLVRSRQDVQKRIQTLRVKTPTANTHIQYLSGGNQQKVIFSRWLMTEPDILILDEPTRGIDVGAKFEIYTLIVELAARGKAIILISSELPEVLGMSDRILVMCEGRLTGSLVGSEATQETVMHLSTRFMPTGTTSDVH